MKNVKKPEENKQTESRLTLTFSAQSSCIMLSVLLSYLGIFFSNPRFNLS